MRRAGKSTTESGEEMEQKNGSPRTETGTRTFSRECVAVTADGAKITATNKHAPGIYRRIACHYILFAWIFIMSASCKTWEKLIPIDTARSLSQAGIVKVFLIAFVS